MLLLFSCDKWDLDRAAFTKVITVGLLEAGSSFAILLGDIEDLRNAEIIETGFILSSGTDDDASLRLGQAGIDSVKSPTIDTALSGDGAFGATAHNLDPATKYYFRAYIRLSTGQVAYGQIVSFVTPGISLEILSVERQSPACMTEAVITLAIDQNQATGTPVGVVWSDTGNRSRLSLDRDSISVGILSGENQVQVTLDLECDKVYQLQGFILSQGSLPILTDVITFTTNRGGMWIKRANFPGSSKFAASFSTKDHGYIIGGELPDQCEPSDLVYEYDAFANTWDFAFVDEIQRSFGTGFSIEDAGFIMGGYETWQKCPAELCPSCDCACRCIKTDLMTFSQGDWSRRSTTLSRLAGAVSFVIGDQVYLGTGQADEGCAGTLSPETSNFIKFNPLTTFAEPVDPLPGPGRFNAAGFSLGEKGYVGGGIGQVLSDLFEFDPSRSPGNQWKEVTLPTDLNFIGVGVMPLISRAIFISGFGKEFEVWEFDPTSPNQWAPLASLSVGGSTSAGIDATLVINDLAYVQLGRLSDNFWLYVPELE